MTILGIDPGSNSTGYGIITSDQTNGFSCIEYGVIRAQEKAEPWQRLKKIYDEILQLCHRFLPDQVALEDIFYGHNIQSALKLGQARGVAIIAAINAGAEIAAYSPREVKLALTGYGAASKEQVQKMVRELLRMGEPATPLDASDALAVALCHAQRYWTLLKTNYKS
ncbi:MAG: crossover junction endodeoxyribonuclease RuvC [Calditrichaeota bacterium]|nr:MAG: crossover junction endodeoxyribonuclease RuvC [Calditrichota bacterium]